MAAKHNLARMLTDLANLHRSAAAIERLRAKYPGFLPDAPSGINFKVRYVTESGQEIPHDVPEGLQYILQLQRMICELWSGKPSDRCLTELQHVLLTGKLGVTVQFLQSLNVAPLPGIMGVDWKHRTFVYRPQTLLQEVLHCLMQESPKAKICANPDCPAPYFIAPRSNARYCSEDCLQAVQRASKRAWWEEKGQEWRESRRNKGARAK
jgi:hypothetical protein